MVRKLAITAALTGALMVAAPTAHAGPDEYLGEIITVGFNFCPRGDSGGGWAAVADQ
jgi:hypothetical protein